MTHHKVGSIYTDMIKPLEKKLYNIIRWHEDKERSGCDRDYPHLRSIHYDNDDLKSLLNIRKIVPLVAETVVKISLWKDASIQDRHRIIYQRSNRYALQLFFSQGSSITFWPAIACWSVSKDAGGTQVSEWSSVLADKMTVDEFVELLKHRTKQEYSNAAPLWALFASRPRPPVKELSPWQKKIGERVDAFLKKEQQEYERRKAKFGETDKGKSISNAQSNHSCDGEVE